MTAEGDDPLTKMAISATQLTLFFAIFSTAPDEFFSDSAGTSTELRFGWLCYFRFFIGLFCPLHQRRKAPLAENITHEPINEPVSSAHPAQRETNDGR
jgi:hypothetical protein